MAITRWQWLAGVVVQIAALIPFYTIVLPAVSAMVGIVHSIVVYFNIVACVRTVVMCGLFVPCVTVMGGMPCGVVLLRLGISNTKCHEEQ